MLFSENCQKEGKEYQNGETVKSKDNDPCILCRCLTGKIVCQELRCPVIPEGCEIAAEASERECCPRLSCGKIKSYFFTKKNYFLTI